MAKAKNTKREIASQKTVSNAIPAFVPSQILKNIKIEGVPPKAKEGDLQIIYLGEAAQKKSDQYLKDHLSAWQLSHLKTQKNEIHFYSGLNGQVIVIAPNHPKKGQSHQGRLARTPNQAGRDLMGGAMLRALTTSAKRVVIACYEMDPTEVTGAWVGMDMAAYRFKLPELTQSFHLYCDKSLNKNNLNEAMALAEGVNWTRHLVNMPPNALHPKSYAEILQNHFKAKSQIKVDVWGPERLKKEGMGLISAVGQGAEHGPHMVHLSYRPKKSNKKAPIAFVGKGVTFDTGGLDIKPSQAMRLMKKDMGGAATLAGVAHWLAHSDSPQPCDFYFALAENSVSSKAMRPSDVYHARNKMTVEIHNTDAEGRLVMADVLDVAVTQKGASEPRAVIDVSTLTGAIKVGLGASVAGLFSNEDNLSESLEESAKQTGDRVWRMPLVQEYGSQLSSAFADISNCSNDSYGGAITAALFLEKFVAGKNWAHLDIYSWKDRADGAFAEAGGSGQGVLLLCDWIKAERY